MIKALPYRAVILGTIGQAIISMLSAVLGAVAIPCCDNPTPEIPAWYSTVATPIHFTSLLLPAFICGLYAQARPVLAGALAAGLGTFLWQLLGTHILAALFPQIAKYELADVTHVFYALSSLSFSATLTISAICHAAAGACAASAGVLVRANVGPNKRAEVAGAL